MHYKLEMNKPRFLYMEKKWNAMSNVNQRSNARTFDEL